VPTLPRMRTSPRPFNRSALFTFTLAALLLGFTATARAQSAGVAWKLLPGGAALRSATERRVAPSAGAYFSLNETVLRDQLAAAPFA
jgi:hypothetical protein